MVPTCARSRRAIASQFIYVAAAQWTLATTNAITPAGGTMDYSALPRVTSTTPAATAFSSVSPTAAHAGSDHDQGGSG